MKYLMTKLTIEQLKNKEKELVAVREYHKGEVLTLTKNINSVRQQITYACQNADKERQGELYKMFGKKVHELTDDEMREYKRTMQKISRDKNKKNV